MALLRRPTPVAPDTSRRVRHAPLFGRRGEFGWNRVRQSLPSRKGGGRFVWSSLQLRQGRIVRQVGVMIAAITEQRAIEVASPAAVNGRGATGC